MGLAGTIILIEERVDDLLGLLVRVVDVYCDAYVIHCGSDVSSYVYQVSGFLWWRSSSCIGS